MINQTAKGLNDLPYIIKYMAKLGHNVDMDMFYVDLNIERRKDNISFISDTRDSDDSVKELDGEFKTYSVQFRSSTSSWSISYYNDNYIVVVSDDCAKCFKHTELKSLINENNNL